MDLLNVNRGAPDLNGLSEPDEWFEHKNNKRNSRERNSTFATKIANSGNIETSQVSIYCNFKSSQVAMTNLVQLWRRTHLLRRSRMTTQLTVPLMSSCAAQGVWSATSLLPVLLTHSKCHLITKLAPRVQINQAHLYQPTLLLASHHTERQASSYRNATWCCADVAVRGFRR